ncbi:unnamed protein product [Staurois parvus]|uniref:Secreted protein n=1 Tax=Staurois parvus TaxID=386267 RepID=A0ABN9FC69_9NEOB|nr:unnamed protein product [Staurois parvus]
MKNILKNTFQIYCMSLTSLAVFPSVARVKFLYHSGNPELHSGLPCGVALGGPCSTYLVLRSRDVSPAASLAISSGRCWHPASVFLSLCDVGTYGREI